MSTHQITAGGALVGLLATTSVLGHWYYRHGRKGGGGSLFKGGGGGGKGRRLVLLAPFGWAALLGVLSSLATGGLMGKTAATIANSSNSLGSGLLSSLAGAQSPSVTRVGLVLLNPGGAVCLIILLLVLLIWVVLASRGVRLQITLGLIAGCTLGPTAGVAGIAGVILAPLFNTVGSGLVGLL